MPNSRPFSCNVETLGLKHSTPYPHIHHGISIRSSIDLPMVHTTPTPVPW